MDYIYTVIDPKKVYTIPHSTDGIIQKTNGVRKTHTEVFDVGNDYINLLASGESLSASTWSSTPTGLSVTSAGVSGTVTYVRLGSGTSGAKYTLTNTVDTNLSNKIVFDKYIYIMSK